MDKLSTKDNNSVQDGKSDRNNNKPEITMRMFTTEIDSRYSLRTIKMDNSA